MGRCSGCSGDRCSCIIKAGSGTRVTGAGTNANPYVIEATGGGEGGGGGGFVPGMIMPFGGSVAPAGWLLANGQAVSRNAYSALFAAIGIVYGAGDNSTTFNLPDLAGAFPFGADAGHAVGSTGGAESRSLAVENLPSHSHTIAHTHDASHNHSASSGAVNLDHGHHFVVGGGGHEHLYASNVNRQNYTSGGTFGGTYAEQTSGTGGGGGHSHEGDTWGVPGGLVHAHSVTVDTRTMSTGGPSTGNSGNTGSGSAFSIMPPYVSVTYIIKT